MHNITVTNTKIKDARNVEFCGKIINIEQKYSLDYWDDYFDANTQKHFFILGRPTIEKEEWASYDHKPAFIARLLAKKKEQSDLKTFCRALNGAFTIVIADYFKQQLTLIRDKLGVYPVFLYKADDLKSFQMSTHPDLLASHIPSSSIDKVSVAEFMSYGFITHPYTYYKEITSFDHSSYIIFDFKNQKITKESYFDFTPQEMSYKDLLEQLVAALKKSVERRTLSHYGKTGVLLSGGGDSRVIICNAVEKPEAYTIYREENKEVQITQEIAKALSIKHHLIQRSPKAMLEGLVGTPKYTGGMVNGGSASWLYLIDNEKMLGVDNLLTGDYADWMLKDITFNVKTKKFLGRNLPINEFASFEYGFYGPNVKLEKLQQSIKDRKDTLFNKDIRKNLGQLQIKRIIPISNEYTSSSRLILQRFLPWESILVDNDVIRSFIDIPPQYKLNAKIYNEALGILCKKIIHIPHANTGIRLGYNIAMQTFVYYKNLIKKKLLGEVEQRGIADSAPLLMFQDQELQKVFYSIPTKYQSLINDILGICVFDLSIEEIAKLDYHIFFNVIAFYCWIKDQDMVID